MKRLEALLTKCKDSIKTNKQKSSALTETNRSLSEQMTEREAECERLRVKVMSILTPKFIHGTDGTYFMV